MMTDFEIIFVQSSNSKDRCVHNQTELSTLLLIVLYLYVIHMYLIFPQPSSVKLASFLHALSIFVGISRSWRELDYVVLAMLVCLCVWRDRYQGFWQFGLCCRFSRLVGRVVNAGVAAVVLLLPRCRCAVCRLVPALLLPFAQFAVRRCLLRCLLRLRLFLAVLCVWCLGICCCCCCIIYFFANCRCGDQHSRVAARVLRSRARLVYFFYFACFFAAVNVNVDVDCDANANAVAAAAAATARHS